MEFTGKDYSNSYPLRYSNGYYPAAGTKDEISPYVLLNYTGNAREQNTRNLVTLGITQDLSMITKGYQLKYRDHGIHKVYLEKHAIKCQN